MDKEVEKFTQQYLASCKEHIERLASDPTLLQKTLEPFMKMQEQYLAGSGLSLGSEEDDDSGSSEPLRFSNENNELADEIKKLKERVTRLERRVLKPKPKPDSGS